MAKVNLNTVRKHFDQLSPEEVLAELENLYRKYPVVQEHYQSELADDTNPLLEQYKAKIRKAYFPKRGKGSRRNSQVRKFIGDYKKVAVFEYDIIDLVLYRVECGVEALNLKPVRQERHYQALLVALREVIERVTTRGPLDPFRDRLAKVKEDAPIDYGFYIAVHNLLDPVLAE